MNIGSINHLRVNEITVATYLSSTRADSDRWSLKLHRWKLTRGNGWAYCGDIYKRRKLNLKLCARENNTGSRQPVLATDNEPSNRWFGIRYFKTCLGEMTLSNAQNESSQWTIRLFHFILDSISRSNKNTRLDTKISTSVIRFLGKHFESCLKIVHRLNALSAIFRASSIGTRRNTIAFRQFSNVSSKSSSLPSNWVVASRFNTLLITSLRDSLAPTSNMFMHSCNRNQK